MVKGYPLTILAFPLNYERIILLLRYSNKTRFYSVALR